MGVREVAARWRRELGLALAVSTTFAALALAALAGASGQYNLTGKWKVAGTGGGAAGVLDITRMSPSTGAFSGTSYNGMFKLKGTEKGTSVKFTQSEPGYISTDIGTVTAGGTKMGGSWHDSNGAGGTWSGKLTAKPKAKKPAKPKKKPKPKKPKKPKKKPKPKPHR